MNEPRVIEDLRTNDGAWRDANRVGTHRWTDGAFAALTRDLDQITTGDILEPEAIELLLGVSFPLNTVGFRIAAVTPLGVWIDDPPEGEIASGALSLIPWQAIFTVTIHSKQLRQKKGT